MSDDATLQPPSQPPPGAPNGSLVSGEFSVRFAGDRLKFSVKFSEEPQSDLLARLIDVLTALRAMDPKTRVTHAPSDPLADLALDPREHELLTRYINGEHVNSIADELGLEPRTIYNHVSEHRTELAKLYGDAYAERLVPRRRRRSNAPEVLDHDDQHEPSSGAGCPPVK